MGFPLPGLPGTQYPTSVVVPTHRDRVLGIDQVPLGWCRGIYFIITGLRQCPDRPRVSTYPPPSGGASDGLLATCSFSLRLQFSTTQIFNSPAGICKQIKSNQDPAGLTMNETPCIARYRVAENKAREYGEIAVLVHPS